MFSIFLSNGSTETTENTTNLRLIFLSDDLAQGTISRDSNKAARSLHSILVKFYHLIERRVLLLLCPIVSILVMQL